jgi:hypothetical protein
VHIAARKRDPKLPPVPEKKSVVGSYALKGMTLSEFERRPIRKTLIFPHRNTDLPFRQPIPKVRNRHQSSHIQALLTTSSVPNYLTTLFVPTTLAICYTFTYENMFFVQNVIFLLASRSPKPCEKKLFM